MYKIAAVTATRAEYGLLSPLLVRLRDDPQFDLDLLVTGTHCSDKHGNTIEEIINDGFDIGSTIPILASSNDAYGVSVTMANALKEFAAYFRDNRPDMLVILGDRTEMLGVASAALNELIPIAHISGGSVTEGAVDDCIRHALTKMSYLHFTTTEEYRKRVIQMGEDPKRVYNTGSLACENILFSDRLTEAEFRKEMNIPTGIPYAVVTYHPVTKETDHGLSQIDGLCRALLERDEFFYIVTSANADICGDAINERLRSFADDHANILFVRSLGRKRYLSAIRYAAFVLGNSSSGVIEAPIVGTPSVNIGDRQKGRIMPKTVVSCGPDRTSVLKGIDAALEIKREKTDIYGDGHASEKMVEAIKDAFEKGIDLKKSFYGIDYE